MKTATLLLCVISLTLAAPIATTILTKEAEDGKPRLKNSHDFISEVQGNNNNTYIIVFCKDEKNYVDDIKKALDAAPQDADLKTYDIFQPSFDGKGAFVLGQIDARD